VARASPSISKKPDGVRADGAYTWNPAHLAGIEVRRVELLDQDVGSDPALVDEWLALLKARSAFRTPGSPENEWGSPVADTNSGAKGNAVRKGSDSTPVRRSLSNMLSQVGIFSQTSSGGRSSSAMEAQQRPTADVVASGSLETMPSKEPQREQSVAAATSPSQKAGWWKKVRAKGSKQLSGLFARKEKQKSEADGQPALQAQYQPHHTVSSSRATAALDASSKGVEPWQLPTRVVKLAVPEDLKGLRMDGLTVTAVAEVDPADQGIKVGDQILEINGKYVCTTEQVLTALKEAKSHVFVKLLLGTLSCGFDDV
jgi:hypothetical protein